MPIRRWMRGATAISAVALVVPGSLLASQPAQAAAALSIAAIQGTGSQTPYLGKLVKTKPSVVTAVYGQGSSAEFRGFVIQTPGSGGRHKDMRAASEAVFVYLGNTAFNVKAGEQVTVTGIADEYKGLTQIDGDVTITKVRGNYQRPKPVTQLTWRSTAAHRENLESMLYQSREKFLVADTYGLGRYGELGLSTGSLPIQPTDAGAPGSSTAKRAEAKNAAIRVTLDDGSNRGFTVTDKDPARQVPYLTATKNVTIGDTLRLDEPVIVDYRNDTWKFNPTQPIGAGDEPATIRPAKPDVIPHVGGAVQVASFNVLNYFTTIGQGRSGCTGSNLDTDGSFNVTFDCDTRGAWDAADLARQQDKIVDAINQLDASVVGLMEIENSVKLGEPVDEATYTLVNALNTAAGQKRWAVVPSSRELQDVADQDVITNALIYQPDEVRLNGSAHALGAEAGANGAFGNARTPIAASFSPRRGGEPLLAVVNHFKSKGSAPSSGPNQDQGDGQGAWNAARVEQAKALLAWLPKLQERTATDSVVLLGDFNSYTHEEPMRVLYRAGFTNAAPRHQYSYSYSGLLGSLDHVLLNKEARKRMKRGDVWNINSVESPLLEYSTYKTTAIDYYTSNKLRSSDHDPVIVGLKRGKDKTTDLTVLNINDFHGRIAAKSPDTVAFFGTIEEQRALAGAKNTLLLSAGDNLGGSLFASSSQQDQPTIDVLNVAGLNASAVGNHEFDKGITDLTGRIEKAASWDYLGANVYRHGTTKPVLKEYSLFKRKGLTIGVIGAVTREVPSLVLADGVKNLDFGDPVDAVNRVASQLTDGKKKNGEADVIIAEYHEGAVAGEKTSTLAEQVAKGGAFAKIVTQTSPKVGAIFTGHTHQGYAWDGPVPGHSDRTRPIIQTESYAALIGKVTLRLNKKTGQVTSYTRDLLPVTSTPTAELVADYPRVAAIKTIVDAALAKAAEIGNVKIGEATAPITRAFITGPDGKQVEDRASESTIGDLVANMLRDQLADPARGGAQIGVQNPGGNRADFDAGDITFGEAASILPFANTLYTTDLTGAQFKTLLEQQWQTNEDGSPIVGSRPYLQLGLSDNVSYTFDATQPWGKRITSVMVDGKALDPAQTYRVAIPSFLATGGDNFWAFKQGTNTRESGLTDLDAWTDYVRAKTPLSPSFAKHAVQVEPTPSTLARGQSVTLHVAKLDMTSLASPKNTTLTATLAGATIGTAAVVDSQSTLQLTIPAAAAPGAATLVLTAPDTGTTVTIKVTIQ